MCLAAAMVWNGRRPQARRRQAPGTRSRDRRLSTELAEAPADPVAQRAVRRIEGTSRDRF
jgi:hypothetical protein